MEFVCKISQGNLRAFGTVVVVGLKFPTRKILMRLPRLLQRPSAPNLQNRNESVVCLAELV